jgi:histidinol-phosphate aminotransferase|tara:strand:- start:977 stop:2005 length:1029 start_codon:yes stop_codon:yes gene_type:complete
MKPHLHRVNRIFDYTDKSEYDFILNQSERSQPIPHSYYTKFLRSLKQEDFAYYPNTKNFKEKICKFYNVKTENLFLSDGSDVGIKSIFETFTTYDRIITSEPSFPMYKVYSELYQCEYFGIPHEKDYTISMENILSNITHDTNLVILANPNSPMGEYKSFDEIRTLLEQDVMVLIDEAYIEFTDNESMIQYIDEYPNLLVTRTFSKGFGAAGCRVGMTFGHKDTIELLSKFRQMYEITGVSMKYCEFLLNNHTLVDTYIQEVKEEKKELVSMLKGYDVIDSNCNWIHFNTTDDNLKTKQIFDKHKVLVKYCELPHDDRKNWCRLTIQPNITRQDFIKELING